MKTRFFSLLAAMLLFVVTGITAQETTVTKPADLAGVWQMCFYTSAQPNMPGELKTSNSLKILSEDGKFTNLVMMPGQGAIIIGSGTYKQTANNAYTEKVEKNLHLPQLVGTDNVLYFEMKGGDVMVLKFFVNKDINGNVIDSWYYETWKRVKMPTSYPQNIIR